MTLNRTLAGDELDVHGGSVLDVVRPSNFASRNVVALLVAAGLLFSVQLSIGTPPVRAEPVPPFTAHLVHLENVSLTQADSSAIGLQSAEVRSISDPRLHPDRASRLQPDGSLVERRPDPYRVKFKPTRVYWNKKGERVQVFTAPFKSSYDNGEKNIVLEVIEDPAVCIIYPDRGQVKRPYELNLEFAGPMVDIELRNRWIRPVVFNTYDGSPPRKRYVLPSFGGVKTLLDVSDFRYDFGFPRLMRFPDGTIQDRARGVFMIGLVGVHEYRRFDRYFFDAPLRVPKRIDSCPPK